MHGSEVQRLSILTVPVDILMECLVLSRPMHRVRVVGDAVAEAVAVLREVYPGVVAHLEIDPDHSVLGTPPTPRGVLGSDGVRASVPTTEFTRVAEQFANWCDLLVVSGQPTVTLPTITVGDAPSPTNGVTIDHPSEITADLIQGLLRDVDPYVTLAQLVERIKQHPDAPHAGAIATFTGRVRRHDDAADPATLQLAFERYDPVATERLRSIEADLEDRDGVCAVELFHRTGVIEDGEDIVFVVVLAGHRTEAFRAVEDGINRLKAEVPIFKHETTTAEDFWVHDPPE
jgi:molybdopterin synthase catalytic subunit